MNLQEVIEGRNLPFLLTVDEAAAILRKTRKAIYSMIERNQLPGVRRQGSRIYFLSRELLDYLHHDCTPSLRSKR